MCGGDGNIHAPILKITGSRRGQPKNTYVIIVTCISSGYLYIMKLEPWGVIGPAITNKTSMARGSIILLFLVVLTVAPYVAAAADVAKENQACYDTCFKECHVEQKDTEERCTKICGFMRSLGCRSSTQGSS